jgi:hypothetical protein
MGKTSLPGELFSRSRRWVAAPLAAATLLFLVLNLAFGTPSGYAQGPGRVQELTGRAESDDNIF